MAELAAEEGRVCGAAALLSAQPMYRMVARMPRALAALLSALLGTAVHRSQRSVRSTAALFVTTAVSFIRPPSLQATQVHLLTSTGPISIDMRQWADDACTCKQWSQGCATYTTFAMSPCSVCVVVKCFLGTTGPLCMLSTFVSLNAKLGK